MFSDDRLTERLDAHAAMNNLRAARDAQMEEIVALASDVLDARVALIAVPGPLGAHFLAHRGLPEPWASAGYLPRVLARGFRPNNGTTPLSIPDFAAWAPEVLTRRIAGLEGGAYLGVPFARPGEPLEGILALVRLRRGMWTEAEIARAQGFARLIEQRLADESRTRHWRAAFEQADGAFFLGLPVRGANRAIRDIVIAEANTGFERFCPSRAASLLARWPEAAPMIGLAQSLTPGGRAGRLELPGPGGRDWHEVRLRLLEDDRLSVTIFEINAHREARIRLTEQQERRKLANRIADIGVWDYAPTTGELTFDDTLRGMLGLTSNQTVARQDAFAAVDPDDQANARAEFAALIAGQRPEGTRLTLRIRGIEDGRLRHILVSGTRLVPLVGPPRIIGAARDISARVEREQREMLLRQELGHRLKNTMTLVHGLVNQTFRTATDLAGARAALLARVRALGAAHDHILLGGGAAAALRDVVSAALAFSDFGAHRVLLSGPDLRLGPRSALHLSLVLHELATNAVKYGALSRDSGHVTISWAVEGELVVLDWRETGGPGVNPPEGTGFGMRLIRSGLTGGDASSAELDFTPEGLFCRLAAPGTELAR